VSRSPQTFSSGLAWKRIRASAVNPGDCLPETQYGVLAF